MMRTSNGGIIMSVIGSTAAKAAAGMLLCTGGVAAFAPPAQAKDIWPVNDSVHVERDVGVRVNAPDEKNLECSHFHPDGHACFDPHGDVWYVVDEEADGRGVAALWEDTFIDANGDEHLARQGMCRNPYGTGSWARCNKDHHENHLLSMAFGGVGADWRVRSGGKWWTLVHH
jgi:hypothetical protein